MRLNPGGRSDRDFDLERKPEAREALRGLAGLRWRWRRALALQAAGFSYKVIAETLGVTYMNVSRHLTEGGRSCEGCARRREESRPLHRGSDRGERVVPRQVRGWRLLHARRKPARSARASGLTASGASCGTE